MMAGIQMLSRDDVYVSFLLLIIEGGVFTYPLMT